MARLHLGTGFLVAVMIFAAGAVAGWVFSQAIAPLLLPSLENLVGSAEKTMGLNPEIRHLALTTFIFLKNLSVAAILVFVGYVVLALPTVFILVVNGTLVGLLARLFIEAGMSPTTFVAGIAPHGIIELPALFLAAGFALALTAQRLKGRGIPGPVRRLGFLLRAITPLLAVAAVVEVYITPLVITRFAP